MCKDLSINSELALPPASEVILNSCPSADSSVPVRQPANVPVRRVDAGKLAVGGVRRRQVPDDRRQRQLGPHGGRGRPRRHERQARAVHRPREQATLLSLRHDRQPPEDQRPRPVAELHRTR